MTMYLSNKYTHWYFNIIQKAQSRNIPLKTYRDNAFTYMEDHHVIPKCFGGSDDKSNIVPLTPKEHFICHLLLTKMTCGDYKRKMIYALWCMMSMKNSGQSGRYIPCSRLFDQQKSIYYNSKRPMSGKRHSDETKIKMSKCRLGNKHHYYGKTFSDKHKIKMIESRSKIWMIVSPDKEEITIKNLNDYCSKHNLDPSAMVKVAKGKAKIHKGYTCSYA